MSVQSYDQWKTASPDDYEPEDKCQNCGKPLTDVQTVCCSAECLLEYGKFLSFERQPVKLPEDLENALPY